jgi:hypothetical protein
MTRSAYIGSVFSVADRQSLVAALAERLPGDIEQQRRFIDAAGEAIDVHRKLTRPAVAEQSEREEKLRRLAKAASEFAEAVEAVARDKDTPFLLRQWQWVELRDGASETSVPHWEQTEAAAKWAQITARAANRGTENARRRRRPGPQPDRALRSLANDIASAYGAIFGERPSAARNGIFARALPTILSAGGVNAEVGETWLHSVIDGAPLPGAPPKRGPKRTRNVPKKAPI